MDRRLVGLQPGSIQVGRAIIAIAVSVIPISVVAVAVIVAVAVMIAIMVAIPAAAVVIAPVAGPFAPLALAAIDDLEIGAAAAIDPDAVAIVAPRAIEDAIGFAALADDEDTVTRINGTESALHVIGRAVDQGGGVSLPVSGNAEIGTATAVDPDAALAIAPGLAFNASGLAALANHAHAEASIGRTPGAAHIIGGAVNHVGFAPSAEVAIAIATAVVVSVVAAIMADDNGWSLGAYFEFRTAAAIDPDSPIVVAPAATLNALGLALLVNHLNAAGGIHEANVPVHVVRIARHSQGGLRGWRCVSGPAAGSDCEDKCRGQ